MSREKANRKVISPSLRPNSSPEHTFEVMQRRLEMAEEETKKLVDQLAEYGFSKDRVENPENNRSGKIEPILPFKAKGPISPHVEILQRNYEQIVSRVCRSESTIQSLKLALCSLEAERNLVTVDREPEKTPLPIDTYEEEIKKLQKDLLWCRKELDMSEAGRKEAQEMLKKLTSELENASQSSEENKLHMEELQLSKQKLSKKVNVVSIAVKNSIYCRRWFSYDHNLKERYLLFTGISTPTLWAVLSTPPFLFFVLLTPPNPPPFSPICCSDYFS